MCNLYMGGEETLEVSLTTSVLLQDELFLNQRLHSIGFFPSKPPTTVSVCRCVLLLFCYVGSQW